MQQLIFPTIPYWLISNTHHTAFSLFYKVKLSSGIALAQHITAVQNSAGAVTMNTVSGSACSYLSLLLL